MLLQSTRDILPSYRSITSFFLYFLSLLCVTYVFITSIHVKASDKTCCIAMSFLFKMFTPLIHLFLSCPLYLAPGIFLVVYIWRGWLRISLIRWSNQLMQCVSKIIIIVWFFWCSSDAFNSHPVFSVLFMAFSIHLTSVNTERKKTALSSSLESKQTWTSWTKVSVLTFTPGTDLSEQDWYSH